MKEQWPGELGGIAQEGPALCGCVSLGRSVGYNHGSSVRKGLFAVTVLSSYAQGTGSPGKGKDLATVTRWQR